MCIVPVTLCRYCAACLNDMVFRSSRSSIYQERVSQQPRDRRKRDEERQQHTWQLHVEGSTPSGRRRRSSTRSGRSQLLRTLPSQTLRRCFRVCANILSMQDLCQREISVGTRILLTQVFCRRQHSVDASILSTATFCWHQHFVNANILSTPTFCRHQHFVDTNILSTPTFSGDSNISVRANILSSRIFCLCLGLRMIIRIKDDYLLLMLVFCVYISWLLLICLKPFRFWPLDTCWSLL